MRRCSVILKPLVNPLALPAAAIIIGGFYNGPTMPREMFFSGVMFVAPFSPIALGTMVLILAASTWVFVTLVHRETRRRRDLALARWAADRGMRLIDPSESREEAGIEALAEMKPRFEKLVRGDRLCIVQVCTDDPKLIKTSSPIWNLIVLRLDAKWAPTGLRPAARSVCVLDLFSLSSFPSLASNLHFMVFGADSTAARNLAAASIDTILPPDIALLLRGNEMILDFTGRHFDEIELSKMMELAKQLSSAISPMPSRK